MARKRSKAAAAVKPRGASRSTTSRRFTAQAGEGRSDLTYAIWGQRYIEACAKYPNSPIKALAEEHGYDPEHRRGHLDGGPPPWAAQWNATRPGRCGAD